MNDIYIARFSSWTPPKDTPSKSPDLSFTDPMFRRRLSQISKMTIQVVHDILPVKEETKLFFLSFRGEIAKQYNVNKMIIQDNTISPAAFSLSVFNAPIALASMALSLKGGYSAIYPGKNSFSTGLDAACAELLTSKNEELVFIYADEAVPQEYAGIVLDPPFPLALGLFLTKKNEPGYVPLSLIEKINKDSAEAFLNQLLSHRGIYVSS